MVHYISILLLIFYQSLTQGCPQGFTSQLGRCLFIKLKANVTWCAANRACADLGAELLTNWTVIRNLNSTIPQSLAWVGVSDLADERGTNMIGWQFVNGRGVMPTDRTVWKPPNDPNTPAQDCAMYSFDNTSSGLIDKECDFVLNTGYVCELPDAPPTPSCGPSGSGTNRIRWIPAPVPTINVTNLISRYCYWEKYNVAGLRDCAMLAGLRTYSRSFLYNSKLMWCHVTEFSDSQTPYEQPPTDWVKYVKVKPGY